MLFELCSDLSNMHIGQKYLNLNVKKRVLTSLSHLQETSATGMMQADGNDIIHMYGLLKKGLAVLVTHGMAGTEV